MTREPLPAALAASQPTAPNRPWDAGAGRDCDITDTGRRAGAVGTPPSAPARPRPAENTACHPRPPRPPLPGARGGVTPPGRPRRGGGREIRCDQEVSLGGPPVPSSLPPVPGLLEKSLRPLPHLGKKPPGRRQCWDRASIQEELLACTPT
uniref:Uncharacterized protein n=1 Tax=Rousettus aegyptiacus TaxID=9407 RepID=A0A7J8BES6_ROUAE|nr:hypothetical protein HJG63_009677 [Rousettus aegyptiacus]